MSTATNPTGLNATSVDAAIAGTTSAANTTWQIDPGTSRIAFSIRKRLFFVKKLTVTGRFSDVSGTITLDEQDPTTARASVTIGTASFDTQNARRDKHVRTADFLDVEQFPTMTFSTRRVEAVDRAGGRYKVVGDLTVRGVKKEVTLDAQYTPAQGVGNGRRMTLNLTAPLKRQDFGIAWSSPVIKVADDLTIGLTVEATRA